MAGCDGKRTGRLTFTLRQHRSVPNIPVSVATAQKCRKPEHHGTDTNDISLSAMLWRIETTKLTARLMKN